MIRAWIGTALLAGSWLFGLNYFAPDCPWVWFAIVAAAVLLFHGGTIRVPCSVAAEGGEASGVPRRRKELLTIIVLLLPAVWVAPWPYRMAPLLMAVGLSLSLLPTGARRLRRVGDGAILAGVVLLVQGLAIEVYAIQTARSHELPWPLPDLLVAVAKMLGMDAAVDGSNIVVYSMRQVHRLAATWELFFDPATFCFFVGGLTMLAIVVWTVPSSEKRWSTWLRSSVALLLLVLAWLPLRAGLLMAVYLQRVLRSDPALPLFAMNQFFSPWTLPALLAVPTLLAWRFVPWPLLIGGKSAAGNLGASEAQRKMGTSAGDVGRPSAPVLSRRERKRLKRNPSAAGDQEPPAAPPARSLGVPLPAAVCMVAVGVALLTAAIYWNPIGERKEGRVMIVERHSPWEPTTRRYDTTRYGEPASYNYAAAYDYLGQYYAMSRLLETDKIDDATLRRCDVLVIKTPETRFHEAEAQAVQRFVEQGGGLLLIGDHTNIFGSSTVMNDIVRPMGFAFRNDLLFSFEAWPYDELYVRSSLPHPAAQHVPRMDFAVSCSMDPGNSDGRPVMVGTRLWSMGPEYHNDNFHPIPQHCPEMRYGTFIQAWAAHYGKGRAVAFGDSTDFSNFCVFQPGKVEILVNMVEWLNHANPPFNPRPWLMGLGLPLFAAGVWFGRRQHRPRLTLLAAGAFGWAVASLAVNAAHAWAMPLPECKRPQTRVVIDHTTSSVPLSLGAFITGGGKGYGLLEQWIPRLGCYTVRKEGDDAFSGDVLAVICPSRPVDRHFSEHLVRYVADGGKLVVIDSPENADSTANDLLRPFGMAIEHDQSRRGTLMVDGQLWNVAIERACGVTGGQPAAHIAETPVAAMMQHGKGAVMAVGFGSLWNDFHMGTEWMLEPTPEVNGRYEVLYAMLRWLMEGRTPENRAPMPPLEAPSIPRIQETKPDAEPLPLEELGPAAG